MTLTGHIGTQRQCGNMVFVFQILTNSSGTLCCYGRSRAEVVVLCSAIITTKPVVISLIVSMIYSCTNLSSVFCTFDVVVRVMFCYM